MTDFSTPNGLAVREAPAPLAPAVASSFGLPDNFADQMRLAEVVAKSDLVDKKLQGKPENVFMVVQKAIGLNISFDLAIAKTHVIDNKVSPSAELLRILLRRAGHDLEIVDLNDKIANGVLRLAHRPGKPISMEFTISKAQAAGYTNKPLWKSDPESMLVAALTRRMVRFHCPEVAAGLDLSDDIVTEFDVVATPPTRSAPVKAAAQRVDTPDPAPAAAPVVSDAEPEIPEPRAAADDQPEEDPKVAAAMDFLAQAQKAKTVSALTTLGQKARKEGLLEQVVGEDGLTLNMALRNQLAELDSASASN